MLSSSLRIPCGRAPTTQVSHLFSQPLHEAEARLLPATGLCCRWCWLFANGLLAYLGVCG